MQSGDAALITVAGLVDEHFAGFAAAGALADGTRILILDVSGMTRMTSFGVRQWLRSVDALPKSLTDLYLLGCPTFFVDQLNMVLNFGGPSQILTVLAPFVCPVCDLESEQVIDVLAERAQLAKGAVPEKSCSKCGGKLVFDETPQSYFAFVAKYAATKIQPQAAQLLAQRGLYTAPATVAEKPPRIIKLVHGSVTYFRIIGTIGSMFRARPFLVGAEGEVVIDLAEVDWFDPLGLREWQRLLKTLAGQVPSITLVDVTESTLMQSGTSFGLARNIAVSSVLVPYRCISCGRSTPHSHNLATARWPVTFSQLVCPICGGQSRAEIPLDALAPLQKASTSPPPASVKLIEQRQEILSRAVTDANVAQAGDHATAPIADNDYILGKYQIVRPLSAGGMAEVFLAKQTGIGGFEKPVALKRIQRQLLETRHLAIDMFLNEAKIAGRLTHPNIVQVLDVGEVGGALYLAMEYVRGKDLRDVLKKLRASRSLMSLGDACYVVREVAQALHHAYWSTDLDGRQLSVVHRDVSPHNVILSYDGSVKLLDFGVAMSSVTEHAETMIVGKWLYMSPEHTRNEPLDHRSDLFSLGVILYLLCTGKMPFAGSSPKDIVAKIRIGQYKPLQQMIGNIPDTLEHLVARLLAADPGDRPQTGLEVAAMLTEIMRTYGIESSPANIAYFVAQTFADEREEITGFSQIPLPPPAELEALQPRHANGSPTELLYPHSAVLDRSQSLPSSPSSPGSLSPNPMSPGSLAPVAVPSAIGPELSSSGFIPADQSMSLRPRQPSGNFPTAPQPAHDRSGPASILAAAAAAPPITSAVSSKRTTGPRATLPPATVARAGLVASPGPAVVPDAPASPWGFRRLLIISLIVALAIVAYFALRPL
ncbi:MAG TPA: serine/threonine-protein kinase [Kofleriaceae bacterium]